MIRVLTGNEAWEVLDASAPPVPLPDRAVAGAVAAILEEVRHGGDAGLRAIAGRLGDPVPDRFRVDRDEVFRAVSKVKPGTREVLQRAAANIRAFAAKVMQSVRAFRLDRDGFAVGMDFVPVRRTACYVPGGRHSLPSSALMTAITARAAGVAEVCIAGPRLSAEVFLAGVLADVEVFYRMGGAQAVAALAFGTDTVEAVDVIVGPGNAYVTEAKRQLQGIVGIDLLAGPSEVAVVADAGAQPDRVALDLLAQWEHDPLARAWLFTDSEPLARAVARALESALAEHALPAFVRSAVDGGAILVFESLEAALDASDHVAPEHLQLAVADPESLLARVRHAGAVFLGYDAAVPFGDYMAGPNHTLPTGRTARFSGGLNPLTFLRPRAWVSMGEGTARLAADAAAFAALEGLGMHAAAARARMKRCGAPPGAGH